MAQPKSGSRGKAKQTTGADSPELVVLTGFSGSGKGTALRAFEDLGYYSVDNLPVGLIPKFAELVHSSHDVRHAALVVDVREGGELGKLPALLKSLRHTIPVRLVFLETDDRTLMRRYSETRRPHPLGTELSVSESIQSERERLQPIREAADLVIDTSGLNVHELREIIGEKFSGERDESNLRVEVTSFGYRHGIPMDSDLVFDVRFLPNPHYMPEFRNKTGRHAGVAGYIRSFPQTTEFVNRISDLLIYLIPHYVQEGKSYLTISFGCTGGHHRSVMIASEIARRLAKAGYKVKETHRDIRKS
ncbi:MAG: RNase adapter RapZ [Bryobacteraceae bacterium]